MPLCKPKRFAAWLGLSLPLGVFAAAPQDARQIEMILIEAPKSELELVQEQALTPGGVTLLDSAELYQRNMTTLADMLRYVPGVWVANGGAGDSSFFSSRGSNLDATSYDGNGIKLLQDGLPVTAADGNNHNRNVDPLSTRFAVVARGANALAYGASTLGGAIDFVTPTVHDTESEIFLTGGSNGQLQGRITAGATAGDVDGLITLEARHWDGYRDHHQQRRKGLYANGGWQLNGALQSRLYFTYIDNDQELPGALTIAQFDDDPYQAEPAAKAGNYQYNVEAWRIANKTLWQLNEHSSLSAGISYEEQALYHPIVYSPFFSLLIDTDQHNAGASLRYNLRFGDHDLLAGLNYGETTVKGGNYSHQSGRRGALMTRIDNKADSLELFLLDRWQVAEQWKLVYGAQLVSAGREVRNITAGSIYNPKDDYQSINPRLGLIYTPAEGIELFTNVSRLYEAPTNYELEDDASPDDKPLDAMSGSVIEIGTRGNIPLDAVSQWQWEVAVYYARLKNEILSIDDPDAPGTSLSTNVDDTVHAGIEALIGASFALDSNGTHRIEPLLNITLNEFSFANDSNYGNNELPAAPFYVIKGEILYRNANGFFAGPTFDIVDERYADFSNTYTVDSYTLLGLRAGFSRETWELYAEVRNLTDREYVSLFSVKDLATPDAAILQAGEPRSLYMGLKVRF